MIRRVLGRALRLGGCLLLASAWCVDPPRFRETGRRSVANARTTADVQREFRRAVIAEELGRLKGGEE
jgi:hypothetical protein